MIPISPHGELKMMRKCLLAAVLLISTVAAASAQTHYWGYGCFGPKARGYYGTPYGGGPQYSSGGDQYGYGPATATPAKRRPSAAGAENYLLRTKSRNALCWASRGVGGFALSASTLRLGGLSPAS